MVFHVNLPLKDSTITFQIYDKDILSADDFISEAIKLPEIGKTNVRKWQLSETFSGRIVIREALNLILKNLKRKRRRNKTRWKESRRCEKKNRGLASGEKVEIMLQNAEKEGYITNIK